MKARIRKESDMYIGEVYGTWNLFFGLKQYTGWNRVTPRCFTKFGTKLELLQWKKKHCCDEFEL